jgi:hypothetical protein
VISGRALLRRQLRAAHDLLELAVETVSPQVVACRPAGPEARAAACYAEVSVGEDLIVNGVLAATHALAHSTWAGRTGLSELPGPGGTERSRWLGRVQVDVPRARAYALAVRTATDSYLARIGDQHLEAGEAELLTALLLDLAARRGEIGCLLCRSPRR